MIVIYIQLQKIHKHSILKWVEAKPTTVPIAQFILCPLAMLARGQELKIKTQWYSSYMFLVQCTKVI